jgi:hypothetical protein
MNMKPAFFSIVRMLLAVTVLAGLLYKSSYPALAASQLDISGPPGSVSFGTSVTVLPNGNIVVTDPAFNGIAVNGGAVYLYNGLSGALISTLTGSRSNDQVGSGGVTLLSNGNYVVNSPFWDNATVVNAGAVTWGDGTTGLSGAISAANSLVGSTANDQVGLHGVTALSNGNYVVRSLVWDNGAFVNAGAVTWGDGTGGTTGAVSAINSLVGGTSNDSVGSSDVTALSNGNYVVRSPNWDNALILNAGAVTWGNGLSGVSGAVSALNSLVGSTAGDQVGSSGVVALTNGNYVVESEFWDNVAVVNAGAVTWGSGTSGVAGAVSAANSLVGSTNNDQVGCCGVAALTNGNYVVGSALWDNVSVGDAGAATWGDGATGVAGTISVANSLVGSTFNDQVSSGGITALSNGDYVVASPSWDRVLLVDAGAATWGDGTSGITGAVTAFNSLVGNAAGDQVSSSGVTALTNGNYVVSSPVWDDGASTDVGAVTWENGASAVSAVVSTSNSLVGSQTSDSVGIGGITALSNGNYVVLSPFWNNGANPLAGAATWGNGLSGITGAVSPANSLVGSTINDQIGFSGVTALSNGNYVVLSPLWENAFIVDAGAATWGNGLSGVIGPVSALNSLVGSQANDQVGSGTAIALSNGNYVVRSPSWSDGFTAFAGAATWGNGLSGVVGAVSPANSLVGSTVGDQVSSGVVTALSNGDYSVTSPLWDNVAILDTGAVTWGFGAIGTHGKVTPTNSARGLASSGGSAMVSQFDPSNWQIVVGRPGDNIVTLFRLPNIFLPVISK